jgi:hypothetical protein
MAQGLRVVWIAQSIWRKSYELAAPESAEIFPLLHRIQTDSGVKTMSIGGLFLLAVGRGSVEMYLHHPSVYLYVVFN